MKLRSRLGHLTAALTGRVKTTARSLRYAGGDHSRIVSNWFAELANPNDELRYSLVTLRARSRQLCRDNGEAAGLLLDFESDIVGPKGARLQFRARLPRGAPRDALNDRVEGAWTAWASRDTCTLAGYENFAALQRLMLRTVIADGEFLALRVRDPRVPFGYALQPLDADQLDEMYNVATDANGVTITMGVETNRNGRPIAYHVWDRHPSLAGRVRRRIDAANVLHVFKRLRPGQVRGVPWFAPALVTWKLGDRYTEAELYQSLLAAAQGGFFVNKSDQVGIPLPTAINPETGATEPVPLTMDAEPGSARILPDGYEFQAWTPTHPTANYVGFMKAVKRVIARAFGRSYASFTGDLSDVNFSSMRTDRVREMEQNKMWQQDILVAQFCDVVFADWLPMAALMGKLGAINVPASDLVGFATWMCRGWPWIDPVKDMAAAELAIKHGLTSRQTLCAERGVDFYEVVDQLAEEAAYALEKGVTLGAADAVLAIDPNAPDQSASDPQPARGVLPLRISA